MNVKDLVLPMLSTVVIATGAAAWNANADNNVQDSRLETIEKQHAESQQRSRELADKMSQQNEQLAVLIERLANLQREMERERESE
jgi:predicted RNase H-like nuclease (RuvC/YqgF family)